MRDLQQYWREIRAAADGLPGHVWLVSLEDPKRGMRGGCMVETSAETAAKLLHASSHRRATDEEIEAYRRERDRQERAAFHEKLRVKGITVVPVAAQKAGD